VGLEFGRDPFAFVLEMGEVGGVVDDPGGAVAFVLDVHLGIQPLEGFGLTQTLPGHQSRDLEASGGIDEHDTLDRIGSTFVEERDVDEIGFLTRVPFGSLTCDLLLDQGMEQCFEFPAFPAVGEDDPSQSLAVDPVTVDQASAKHPADRFVLRIQHLMGDRIGIDHPEAQSRENRRGSAFACGDPSGQNNGVFKSHDPAAPDQLSYSSMT